MLRSFRIDQGLEVSSALKSDPGPGKQSLLTKPAAAWQTLAEATILGF